MTLTDIMSRVNPPESIYLDYAAATPMDERVLEAMRPYFAEKFFNPSSPYAPAVEVRREYEAAKDILAHTFGAKGEEIIITAGATESINLAFTAAHGRSVISAVEHPAVLEAAKRAGEVTIVPVTKHGVTTAEAVAQALTPETTFVSVQLANNEIGTIQPLRDIADVIETERRARAEKGNTTPLLFHSDASQGFGQLDVHVARLGVDMLTLNAAKIYGPKGVGLLWSKPLLEFTPLLVGGGQERGLRSGTENVAGTVGFAKAAELASMHAKSEHARLADLRDTLQKKLLEKFPKMIVSGHPKRRLAGSLHVAFAGIDAERLIFALETRGIYVATGSACAANKGTRSHVLTAIGLLPHEADGSLRITLGAQTTREQIERIVTEITQVVRAEYDRMNVKELS